MYWNDLMTCYGRKNADEANIYKVFHFYHDSGAMYIKVIYLFKIIGEKGRIILDDL